MIVEIKGALIVAVGITLIMSSHGHLAREDSDESSTLLEQDYNEIDETTRKIERLAVRAENSAKLGIVSEEDTDVQYDNLADVLDYLIENLKDSNKAYQFLTAKGINRLVVNNLGVAHPAIKAKLLILLKVLFDVAPVTTTAVIPKSLVTRLLDIFENDNNLALKARALDVLAKWLPKNPDIQIRVMKTKGLEPFYSQINKLDISVIKTLLDLFNTILKEHVGARREDAQVTKADQDRQVMYQRIGLLERMETENVCNGLVNILQVVWAYNNNGEVVKTVVELIKNTKPYCADILKGKAKAIALLENLLKFVQSEDKKPLFESSDLNTSEVEALVEDYVDKVKVKDEF